MSEHPTIFEIFADVKREVRAVGKGSRNTQQNFMYRGVDAVVNAAAPALDKHGVITAPHLDKMTYGTVEAGKARTPMAHAQVEVTYTFYGPRGDSFTVTVPGEAMDSGDKATAKAMSVAYRIALLQALNLPTDDPDPDGDSYERSPAMPQGRPEDPEETRQPWLAPNDPWRERIAAVNTAGDAEKALAELRELAGRGEISRDRATAAKNLLDARAAEIRQQAARPATTDGEWLDKALAEAAGADADRCRSLWRESAEKVRGGTVTRPDAQRLQELLKARIEDLGRQAKTEAAA